MDDNNLNLPNRRRIVQPQEDAADVVVVPQVDRLVSDALAIIGSELAYYRAKTKRGVRLDTKEARIVRDYTEALIKLSKESREAARAEDLSNLTDAELLQLAERLTKKEITE